MINWEWVDVLRVTGNDFLDFAILQFVAVAVVVAYAELVTRLKVRS